MLFNASSLLFASLVVAPASDRADPPPDPPPDRQPWPIVIDGGVRALGFKPFPANPTISLGTEVELVTRGRYTLLAGFALGGSHQIEFSRVIHLDAVLGQRFTAPFGLYGDFDVIVGGQLSTLTGTRYRVDPNGRLRASRSPVIGAMRLGLGVALGLDLSSFCRAPVRLFVRYRQLAESPFMRGNGLLAMGSASLTGGLAVELGTWIRTTRE